jgi:hypothetical protein
VKPNAKGADLIHAEIIRNLETADVVLCDMSCLNANVLFEFGIRTALNKSVCVVRDEHTKHVPFDTGILNHLEYKSTIEPWELEAQVDALASHLSEAVGRSGGTNALWRYFGLKTEARPAEGRTGDADKLDYLMMQVDSIQHRLQADWAGATGPADPAFRPRDPMNWLKESMETLGVRRNVHTIRLSGDNHYIVESSRRLPDSVMKTLAVGMQQLYGASVSFEVDASRGAPASSLGDRE